MEDASRSLSREAHARTYSVQKRCNYSFIILQKVFLLRKFSVLGIKNHRSAAVRGGGAGCALPPPPGSASDTIIINVSIKYKRKRFYALYKREINIRDQH